MPTPDSQLKYVPVLQAQIEADIEQRLDLLSASYLNIQESISNYAIFIVDAAHEFRPEKIAHRYYGSKFRWRLICLFNGIINPLQDLYAGREIRIPDINEVDRFLAAAAIAAPNVRATSGFVDI